MTQTSKQAAESAGGNCCCPDIDQVLEPRFFRALCDPNRIAMLIRLARCCTPRTVSELNSCCPVNISVVSRHLATLRDAGILEAEKRGKEVYYSVKYDELVSTLRSIADAIEACCSAGSSNTKENQNE